MEKEQVAWKESKSHGKKASRVEREQVAWKKSKSSGTRASRVGHVAWDEWPSRPRYNWTILALSGRLHNWTTSALPSCATGQH